MAAKIKVANIIEVGKISGPQIRIAVVAAAIKDRVETTVVMPADDSEAFQARCSALGIPYKTFPISRITKEWRVALRYVLCSFAEILRLARYFRREGFDLVHVSGGSWQYKGVIAGKLAGKKVLWHLNDTARPGFILRMFAVVSRLADGFIFASERTRVYYRPFVPGGRPEFVIPAPVDTARFDPQKEYPGEEKLLGSWSGKIVLGTVAQINTIKGIEVFIAAAGILNSCFQNLCFAVVGPVYKSQQRYFDELRRLCEQKGVTNIEFVGERGDVRPMLKRFDVYVCSSLAESSPIAVWEAMAMGKPVVSTEVGDVPLYIRDGYNGFVVPVQQPAALATGIGRLIADEGVRREFGRRARDTAVKELDLQQCADRHLKAYSAMLNS